MQRPWLSVIVPTHNGGQYLAAAMESVVRERADDIEVVAVDDGSTDDTVDVLRHYAKHTNMTILARAHSGNWAASTNAGMAAARGRYLCWLHQDDFWQPDRLDVLRQLCRQQPAAVLFVHPCWYAGADGRRIGYWHCPLPRRRRAFRPAEVIEQLLVQCWVASCGTIFRADAAAAAGTLDEDLWYSADWDFWLRLARLGPTVYCPSPLASFRLHAQSQTMQAARRGRWPGGQQTAVLAEHLAYFERSFPERASVARVARFSADVNSALAALMAGTMPDVASLLRDFLALSPGGWRRYFRDSRIVERCISRIQAGVLWAPSHSNALAGAVAGERATDQPANLGGSLALAAAERYGG